MRPHHQQPPLIYPTTRTMPKKKGSKKNQKSSSKVSSKDSTINNTAAASLPLDSSKDSTINNTAAESLPLDEQSFLQRVSIDCKSIHDQQHQQSKNKRASSKEALADCVRRAVHTLEHYHMCILHGALSETEISEIHCEYESLLDLKGDSAIGEKDASKRSGTRFYNCKCQVGPACKFHGWKSGSENTKQHLHKSSSFSSFSSFSSSCSSCSSSSSSSSSSYKTGHNNRQLSVWKNV